MVMPAFCKKCGSPLDPNSAFCDNCGAPVGVAAKPQPLDVELNTDDAVAQPAPSATHARPYVTSLKVPYIGVALAATLVIGGGAMYFVLQPPGATASTLLSAAKAGYGRETTDRLKRELCISNIDYSKSTFNAGENDQRTQAWMNALVIAGLYKPPVMISSGGYFAQSLQQYVATPELEKFRQSTKLCAAKDVEFAEVTDIQKPEEQSLGRNGGSPKVLMVKSKLLLKSLNTASWMEQSEVRDAVMSNINGWEYRDRTFQKKIDESFGLKDNKWVTGIAYKDELQQQHKNAQRNINSSVRGEGSTAGESVAGGFGYTLSNFFRAGHPLRGTWRNSNQGEIGMIADFGAPGPGGIKMTKKMTFTSDSIETDGQSVKCKFETNGKRIKVTPEGQNISLIFNIEDDASMSIDLTGIGTFRYVRTE
jgi:hypothetical protein